MHKERIRKVQNYLAGENLDGLIVSRLVNIRYLCGFTGSAGLLVIRPHRADFLTDFRYKDQARKQVRGARVNITAGDAISGLKDMKSLQGKNLKYGYESQFLICSDLKRIEEGLKDALLLPTTGAVEQLSVIKDVGEIALIEKAVEITDISFSRILGYLRPGLRESDVRAELEYQMMSLGSDRPGFETIVASGYRSALPHGVASDKKIARGDFVTFDFGANYKGYTADMTRTVVVGKATPRQKKIYSVVLNAQRAAIRRARAGASGKSVDKAARDIIEKAGFGKYFGHGTGHGIGIFIHSWPNLSTKSKDILRKGMVVTIEPGIYIPGWGGVRIEDDVVITTTGCRVLTQSPKKLLEV